MKPVFLIIFIFIVAVNGSVFGQETASSAPTKAFYELTQEVKSITPADGSEQTWSKRKTRAVILSALIPGTGQTYLGSEYKGVGLTVGFLGSVVTAALSQSNFKAREDRLDALLSDYKRQEKYADAEAVWQNILREKADRQSSIDRRNVFSILAIAIWVYSMVDIVYLTDDEGVKDFSLLQPCRPNTSVLLAQNNLIGIRINL